MDKIETLRVFSQIKLLADAPVTRHIGIFHVFVIARVATAATMSQPRGVIEDLFIGIAFRVNILKGRTNRFARGQRSS
jgi:hypothetical protein